MTPVVVLARKMAEIAKKLSPEEQALLEEVWSRLENAETSAVYWEAKYKGTWPSSA